MGKFGAMTNNKPHKLLEVELPDSGLISLRQMADNI